MDSVTLRYLGREESLMKYCPSERKRTHHQFLATVVETTKQCLEAIFFTADM